MSNDMTLFTSGGALAVPEHLRGIEVDEQTKALAGGAGGLRISFKGGVWRLMNNGEEVAKNDNRFLNVVIVRSSPDTARTYYEGEYVEGEAAKPPTCWSLNGVAPEPEVKEKQSASCATCPQNVAGSGNNDSRACRFSRALAVVMEGDIGGKVYKIQLPATSIFGKAENNVMPLQAYGKLLVQHNLPVNAVVTEMRFDTNVSTPKIGFKAARYLTEDEFALAKQQGETPEAIAATKTTNFQQDAGEPAALGLPGKPATKAIAAQASDTATVVESTTPAAGTAVVAQPAVTVATTPKRTRAKAQPVADAAANAAASVAAPVESVGNASQTTTSAPSPATGNVLKVMTDKAEFSYAEYIEAGWDDEGLVAEGLLVVEAPKKPAPPPAPKKPAAPPPKTVPAPTQQVEAEPVVVQKPAAQAMPEIQNVANLLSQWDE